MMRLDIENIKSLYLLIKAEDDYFNVFTSVVSTVAHSFR